ncbi:MAG: hypothetical protein V2B18_21190 [Pseudomonadota bacterium]
MKPSRNAFQDIEEFLLESEEKEETTDINLIGHHTDEEWAAMSDFEKEEFRRAKNARDAVWVRENFEEHRAESLAILNEQKYVHRRAERGRQFKYVSLLGTLPMLMHVNGDSVVCGRYRDSKPFGLVIRARLDNERVRPEELVGKRILWIFKLDHDRKGNLRPYLRLYARTDGPKSADNELHVLHFFEKKVNAGATAHGTYAGKATLIHDTGNLYSGGAETHWERHVIVIVPASTPVQAWIDRKGANGRSWGIRVA